MIFDRIDRAILHALQSDGRLSNVALATKVNLSESAVLRRVRQLEEAGVIAGYAMLVDQAKVGYPSDVFVQISLHRQQGEDLEKFEAAVRDVPEVMECYLMTGDADYLLRVVASDAADFERIHTRILTRLPGVARVRSSFSLRTVVKKSEVPIRSATPP
ncbi:MAG: Lrp/AsnC family transcriptional regulator [Gammaproteobacteria bacterium]|nr:Lrp/AsnC family transcriptional regulator [Gammaproteobacteria bacterium]MBI5616124.1 Lrp/AsnC family transcriptional regulator [Gammaproteobacteria bacterium]